MIETNESEQETQPNSIAKPMSVDSGSVVAKDAVQLGAFLTQIHKGGGFPERFDSREKRLAAYNLAHSLMGEQWQLALNHIAIIKGQMCIYGEFPGTLAERTGEVMEKEVYLLDSDYQRICVKNKNLNAPPFAAVCNIKRSNRVKKEFIYTLEDAEKAGQYPAMKYDKKTSKRVTNDDSPWMKFTKIMLMRKAMALAIKFEFPDALVGVPIAEYDFDELPEARDVTPKQNDSTKADLLNSNFMEEEQNGSGNTEPEKEILEVGSKENKTASQ